MSSRRSVRQLLVAVLLGVLVGGGLMAVTPAGAEVSQAAATSWKKIWKKQLKPLAAKTFYTKKQSDAAYQPKGSYEAAGSGYTKAETYSKAEVNARLAPFVNSVAATAGGNQVVALTPTVQVVRSLSLMPPSNGTVIVSSSGQIATSTAGVARCSISLSSSLDGDGYQNVSGAGGDYATVAGTRGFTVTKDTLFTVNLVCDEFSGDHILHDSSLTAIFAPS